MLLPGSFDCKWAELLGLVVLKFVFEYLVDTASARPLAQLLGEFGEFSWAARGNYFNVASLGILHPSAQANLGGFAMDEPAEADALDAAFDEKVFDHD
jgi:hypothetical protein